MKGEEQTMNYADLAILLVIGLAAWFAFRSIRRKGKGCSCGCSECQEACGKKR